MHHCLVRGFNRDWKLFSCVQFSLFFCPGFENLSSVGDIRYSIRCVSKFVHVNSFSVRSSLIYSKLQFWYWSAQFVSSLQGSSIIWYLNAYNHNTQTLQSGIRMPWIGRVWYLLPEDGSSCHVKSMVSSKTALDTNFGPLQSHLSQTGRHINTLAEWRSWSMSDSIKA